MALIGKASPKDYNIHPSLYPWARELYDQAIANTWYPHEIPLKEDLEDWATMTDDEKFAVEFVMSHDTISHVTSFMQVTLLHLTSPTASTENVSFTASFGNSVIEFVRV